MSTLDSLYTGENLWTFYVIRCVFWVNLFIFVLKGYITFKTGNTDIKICILWGGMFEHEYFFYFYMYY